MSETPTRAAGYIRVSTEEQRKHGWNLGADRERIERTVAERGWTLHAIYDDGGRQGDDPTRPGFIRMLAEAGEFEVLIMRDLDRFSRKLAIYASAVDDLLEAGVTLYEFEGDDTGLKRLNLDDEDDRALADVKAVFAQLEKAKTKRRVRQSVQARVRAGRHVGTEPWAYRFDDDGLLVVIPELKVIVVRIFTDYVRGMSQRALVRALNDDKVPAPEGGEWLQSEVGRILRNVAYMGKIKYRVQVLDGVHEAIVTEELWLRAEMRRAGAHHGKSGRWPDGLHLCTNGLLRCGRCGSAMVCRKARPGMNRECYVCKGRIEHGVEFCDQPSIRRELVDEPLLAHLLDGYIDVEATKRLIEERTSGAVKLARDAFDLAHADALKQESRQIEIKNDYIAGRITAEEWHALKDEVAAKLEKARGAEAELAERVQEAEQARLLGDAEQWFLDHLAALKQAAAGIAGDAPDLNALRNVIGQMFERVVLVPGDDFGVGMGSERIARAGGGFVPYDVERFPPVDGGGYLVPVFNWSVVDRGALEVIPQEMPVGHKKPEPHLFFSRYCWW